MPSPARSTKSCPKRTAPCRRTSWVWYLGQWIEQANLAVIALVVKDANEEYAPTLEHVTRLGAGLAEAREGLLGAFEGWPLAEKASSAIDKAKRYVSEAPPLDDASQEVLDVADDYQEALHELTGVVEEVEKALG